MAMIKNFLFLLAVVQMSLGAPQLTQDPGLVQGLLSSLPMDNMRSITEKHLQNDPGFQAAIQYFKSPEWLEMVANVRNLPEWQAYKSFLKSKGFDLEPLLAQMTHCLNATATEGIQVDAKPNLADFLADLKREFAVPLMVAAGIAHEKIEKNPQLKKMIGEVVSIEGKELLEKSLKSAEMKKVLGKIAEMNIKVQDALVFVYSAFEWQIPEELKSL